MSRPHSKYDWPHHISQQEVSGLSIKEYCARHGFSSWSFYVNRQKLKKTGSTMRKENLHSKPSFLDLGTLQKSTSLLITFPDGTRIEFNGLQNTPEYFISILKALHTKRGTRC